jgi:hypothetical protein
LNNNSTHIPDQLYPPTINAYMNKWAASGPWRIEAHTNRRFSAAVVIPALAESGSLPHTLHSLSRNPRELLARTLILVVVNQRTDAKNPEKSDNRATLAALPGWKEQFGLETLHWVDAASAGKELPPKQGVGLARKIGLDLALQQLDYRTGDPLLICLDSDTLVQPDYLGALIDHFAGSAAGGASIPYRHRTADTPQGQAAIDRYELFLRVYVLGLGLAGSPYAFHTVGSAMACRASAYATGGGMNRRLAGEDFYFLQQLHKTSGVSSLTGTIVHPSPRSSHRVPFGTGRSVGDILADGDSRLLFYRPELFDMLGEWLACVSSHRGADGNKLLECSGRISPNLREFLQQAGFGPTWDNLLRHNRDADRLASAFHGWFDAFRTMRIMHHLTDCGYPRIPPEQAVPPVLERAGLESQATVGEMLDCLRKLQGV